MDLFRTGVNGLVGLVQKTGLDVPVCLLEWRFLKHCVYLVIDTNPKSQYSRVLQATTNTWIAELENIFLSLFYRSWHFVRNYYWWGGSQHGLVGRMPAYKSEGSGLKSPRNLQMFWYTITAAEHIKITKIQPYGQIAICHSTEDRPVTLHSPEAEDGY
jgi:hypothetical protein